MNLKNNKQSIPSFVGSLVLLFSFFTYNFSQTALLLTTKVDRNNELVRFQEKSSLKIVKSDANQSVLEKSLFEEIEDDDVEFTSSSFQYFYHQIESKFRLLYSLYFKCFNFTPKIPLFILYKQLKAYII